MVIFASGICLADGISIPGDCGYPATASEGNSVYVACLGADEKPANLYFRRSIDEGRTWTSVRRINKKNGGCLPPSIAVNSGAVHLAWIDNGETVDGEIYYARSLDGGETWGKNVILVKNANRAQYLVIKCKENNVYLSWQDVENNAFFKVSNDRGRTWENETLLEKAGKQLKKSDTEKNSIEKRGTENISMTSEVAHDGLFSAIHGMDVSIDARGGFGSHSGFDTAQYTLLYNRFEENVDVLQPLSDNESFSLKSKYLGTINTRALPQYNLPQLNQLVFGIETRRLGDLFMRYGYDFYEPPASFLVQYLSSANLVPIYSTKLTNGEANWTARIKYFTFHSIVDYVKLDYKYPGDAMTSQERDAELWVDIGGQFDMGDGLRGGGGFLLKNDLNASPDYNYDEASVFIGGLHFDKFAWHLVDWQVSELFVRNQVMFNRGYGVGNVTDIHVRPIIRFSNKLYIKSDIRIQAGDGFLTQRYEIHLNKTWRNDNYFTGGVWISAGGLFPRINMRLLQKLNFGPVGLMPSFLIAWRPSDDRGFYILHRTILGIEPTFRINRFLELYGGYSQTFYNGQTLFSGMYNGFLDNSNFVYFGIRKW